MEKYFNLIGRVLHKVSLPKIDTKWRSKMLRLWWLAVRESSFHSLPNQYSGRISTDLKVINPWDSATNQSQLLLFPSRNMNNRTRCGQSKGSGRGKWEGDVPEISSCCWCMRSIQIEARKTLTLPFVSGRLFSGSVSWSLNIPLFQTLRHEYFRAH